MKKDLIKTNIIFVSETDLIQDVVKTMIEKEVGSVLVRNEQQNVVGILTERDIVRKFTLLDVEDKLTRTVNTVMSRPVKFVTIQDIPNEIGIIHMQTGIRHFPILNGKEPKVNSVVGIVSLTDLGRHYVTESKNNKQILSLPTRPLAILAKNTSVAGPMARVFRELGFKIDHIQDFHAFVNQNPKMDQPLIFDLDTFPERELKVLITAVNKYKGDTIIATSNPSLVAMFRRFIKSDHKYIAIKPLDFSYCHWLLTKKWVEAE